TRGECLQDQGRSRMILFDQGLTKLANGVHFATLGADENTLEEEVLVVLAAHFLVLIEIVVGPVKVTRAASSAGGQKQRLGIARPDAQTGLQVRHGLVGVIAFQGFAGSSQVISGPEINAAQPGASRDKEQQGGDDQSASGVADQAARGSKASTNPL